MVYWPKKNVSHANHHIKRERERKVHHHHHHGRRSLLLDLARQVELGSSTQLNWWLVEVHNNNRRSNTETTNTTTFSNDCHGLRNMTHQV